EPPRLVDETNDRLANMLQHVHESDVHCLGSNHGLGLGWLPSRKNEQPSFGVAWPVHGFWLRQLESNRATAKPPRRVQARQRGAQGLLHRDRCPGSPRSIL